MSDNLWKPNKEVRAKINHGDRKVFLRKLRQDGVITDDSCNFCGRLVCLRKGYSPLNLNGYPHKCKGLVESLKYENT